MKTTPPTPPRGNPPATPRSIAALRPPTASAGNKELERALVLRDVMDHAVRVQKEITAPRRLGTRFMPAMLAALIVLLLGAAAYSWIAHPEIIWGPRLQPTAARHDANVRVAMVLLAQKLDARRRADGAYPGSVSEIGEAATGIAYSVTSDSTFELRGRVRDRELVLRSTDSRDAFLGDAIARIGGHAR
ncbi:MAG TPA: hypothetical protein VKH19_00840 [Gemmatimonadaceae bacterium]|nr:hypothetical protein [Gemmatimonadaceae bacterium]